MFIDKRAFFRSPPSPRAEVSSANSSRWLRPAPAKIENAPHPHLALLARAAPAFPGFAAHRTRNPGVCFHALGERPAELT